MSPTSALSWPSDPHLARWMLFIDGENLTLRTQQLAKDNSIDLKEGPYFSRNVFIWMPNVTANQALTNIEKVPMQLRPNSIRSYYYTSLEGDDGKISSVRRALWELGFQPEVFKKSKQGQKGKGVDITLAKDMLSNAYDNNYDVAVLMAGDGDYVPLVTELKRLGKLVYVVFSNGPGYGLSPELELASDTFFSMDNFFLAKWNAYLSETAAQGGSQVSPA